MPTEPAYAIVTPLTLDTLPAGAPDLEAAATLGVSGRGLWQASRRYGIDLPRTRRPAQTRTAA